MRSTSERCSFHDKKIPCFIRIQSIMYYTTGKRDNNGFVSVIRVIQDEG